MKLWFIMEAKWGKIVIKVSYGSYESTLNEFESEIWVNEWAQKQNHSFNPWFIQFSLHVFAKPSGTISLF